MKLIICPINAWKKIIMLNIILISSDLLTTCLLVQLNCICDYIVEPIEI
jgi:hypothetical protein